MALDAHATPRFCSPDPQGFIVKLILLVSCVHGPPAAESLRLSACARQRGNSATSKVDVVDQGSTLVKPAHLEV